MNIHGQALPASLVLRIEIDMLGMMSPNMKRSNTRPNNAPRYSFIADPIPAIIESKK